MSGIFALNFDSLSSPLVQLNLRAAMHKRTSLGWGIGWYPSDNQAANVVKDPAAKDAIVTTDRLIDWKSFRSTTFMAKVKDAMDGYTHHETQPFSRSFAGRDWLFVHQGNLDKTRLKTLYVRQSRLLEPLGTTDSEIAFCYLLSRVQLGDARKLSDIDPTLLLEWFTQLDLLGSSDIMITDGVSMVCYHGTQSAGTLRYARSQPPNRHSVFESTYTTIKFTDPKDIYHTVLLISSCEFEQGNWVPLMPGQLIIIRRGAIVWSNQSFDTPIIQIDTPVDNSVSKNKNNTPSLNDPPYPHPLNLPDSCTVHHSVINTRGKTHTHDGKSLSYRLFDVKHTTHYSYQAPVEYSTHVFRLQPHEDHIQELVRATLCLSIPGEEIQYEDVFGNQSIHYSIEMPYQALIIESNSRVKIFACPPDDYSLSRRRVSIPLIWMPWQRQMMMAYLLPNELPETELIELTDYAMSFVERNDYHLLNTLTDINQTIYREYCYLPHTTSLSTTPFKVYSSRQGVCQDFANLFICLSRLLGIPARYRMGYIYTGSDVGNSIQSEASHAWAEVYLPYIGWRGYDPTNGCDVKQTHIRVACGRNYRDATPTSGTLFRGGIGETLLATVEIKAITET